jgi:hypothetical protein
VTIAAGNDWVVVMPAQAYVTIAARNDWVVVMPAQAYVTFATMLYPHSEKHLGSHYPKHM